MSSTAVKPPYSNIAYQYMVPVWILGAIALGLVIARIYTRLRRTGSLHPDDWLIVFAEPLSFINVCIASAAVAHGWGKPRQWVDPTDLAVVMKLQFALQVIWIVTLCLVRLSVASSLLRYGTSRSWTWTLYFIMGLQVLISASWFVLAFAQCTPVSANWENVPNVKCWGVYHVKNYGWAVAGIYIIMDLVLTFMPIKLIRSLHRSTSERFLIGVLMSLGLIATAFTVAKIPNRAQLSKGDPLQATILPSIYAKLEETVGIIACSAPCLKSPTEQLLKRFGILKERQLTRPSFVNSVRVSPLEKELDSDQGSGSDSSGPGKKGGIRIDSVAVKPRSSNSTPMELTVQQHGWDAV
ncbi:hypothetical protein K458DRAFT_481576 [Lentithecium fluviatile CBS 122367]|uniref:Rhodopsin domain-containing protein n=1 Tax=Lentithecium fluviatile CBS 122367 TaxID=1168545 RepID=A0A6G1IG05_9PLEO|nr:hypothetical protein K458DRAFT_481576 [Lentithecium fluviatile CBS 122367]